MRVINNFDILLFRDVKLELFCNQSLSCCNRLLTDDQVDGRQSWHVKCCWWVVSVCNDALMYARHENNVNGSLAIVDGDVISSLSVWPPM